MEVIVFRMRVIIELRMHVNVKTGEMGFQKHKDISQIMGGDWLGSKLLGGPTIRVIGKVRHCIGQPSHKIGDECDRDFWLHKLRIRRV